MAERYNHCHGAVDLDVNRLLDVISASLSVCADDHGPLEVYIRQQSWMKIHIPKSVFGLNVGRTHINNELSPPNHMQTLPPTSYNNQLNVPRKK